MEVKFVLDTSAIIAFLENEAGAETVQEILEKAESGEVDIYVSFISFMEIYYVTIQKKNKQAASERLTGLSKLPVNRVESNALLGKTAGEMKARHRLSLADAWIAALASSRKDIAGKKR
ncbi:MAG: PIN domain-containing protein [bacterium]